ncbi:MAG: bifunctional DNA-formamidopyrimidine glycosylase/DNA-(apurinic or apyrimidinic site) lyase [Bosea sp. (in: a-proteobacteria)]
MPELPEVETVRRGLQPVMEGARIARLTLNRKDLRFPFPPRFKARVEGKQITSLSRRAKYLVASLDSGESLIMHLGMSGRFLIMQEGDKARAETANFQHEAGRLPQHDHVVFETNTGTRIIYNDTRRFGFMDLAPSESLAESKHFKAMGIEPLGNELSGETLARLFDGKLAPLKAALLDQRLIAGLGNIYVCEALFRARLHPEAPAGSIAGRDGSATDAATRLAGIIRDVLTEAVEAGGSTLRDFAHADGSLGYFQHRFRVYGREGEACVTPGCGGIVTRIVQAGRSTFFCERCQGKSVR